MLDLVDLFEANLDNHSWGRDGYCCRCGVHVEEKDDFPFCTPDDRDRFSNLKAPFLFGVLRPEERFI